MPFVMEEEHQEDIGIFGGIVMSDILPNGEEADHVYDGVAIAAHDSELEDFDDDEDDDEDIANAAPVADMDVVDAIVDEAIRPSRSASPAKPPGRKTPHSVRTASAPVSAAASSGRKRKSAALEAEPEATPAKRRGRPPRTAASARLAAKAATKGVTRGRPKKETSSNVAKVAGKRGRPRKSATTSKGEAEGKVPAGEYEVEEIVDSAIDADTLEHMYRVKWKGYSLKETTWEPRMNLEHSAELVRAYDAKMKKARKDEAAAGGADKEVKKVKKKPGRKPKAKA